MKGREKPRTPDFAWGGGLIAWRQARFSLGKEPLSVSAPAVHSYGETLRLGQPRGLNSGKVIDYRDISR
jgi:hypothetical protein